MMRYVFIILVVLSGCSIFGSKDDSVDFNKCHIAFTGTFVDIHHIEDNLYSYSFGVASGINNGGTLSFEEGESYKVCLDEEGYIIDYEHVETPGQKANNPTYPKSINNWKVVSADSAIWVGQESNVEQKEDLQKGDILYFDNPSDHSGLYYDNLELLIYTTEDLRGGEQFIMEITEYSRPQSLHNEYDDFELTFDFPWNTIKENSNAELIITGSTEDNHTVKTSMEYLTMCGAHPNGSETPEEISINYSSVKSFKFKIAGFHLMLEELLCKST